MAQMLFLRVLATVRRLVTELVLSQKLVAVDQEGIWILLHSKSVFIKHVLANKMLS